MVGRGGGAVGGAEGGKKIISARAVWRARDSLSYGSNSRRLREVREDTKSGFDSSSLKEALSQGRVIVVGIVALWKVITSKDGAVSSRRGRRTNNW